MKNGSYRGKTMRINKEQINDFEFMGNSEIDYITIEETVTRVGEKAFSNTPNLIRVVIEESDIPIRICLDAFKNCKNLVEINTKREVVFFKKIKHGKPLQIGE